MLKAHVTCLTPMEAEILCSQLSRPVALLQPLMLREAERFRAAHRVTDEAPLTLGPPAAVVRIRVEWPAFRPNVSLWPEIPVDVRAVLAKHRPGSSAGFVRDMGAESRCRSWYTAISVRATLSPHCGWSPFAIAVLYGDLEAVSDFLDLLELAEGREATADFLASATEWSFGQSFVALANLGKSLFRHFRLRLDTRDHIGVIKELVRRGAGVDHRDYFGYTAFHQAVLSKPLLDVAKVLLSLGANINTQSMYGTSPLSGAIMAGDEATVRWLFERGGDLDVGAGEITARRLGSRVPRMAALIASLERRRSREAARLAGDMRCATCGKTEDDARLQRCARCHIPYYCSLDCQRSAWPGHKA